MDTHTQHCVIYCAKDRTNGKCYVGQTTGSLHLRRRKHLRNKSNTPFANALRKRPRKFVWTVLEEGEMTFEQMDEAETRHGTALKALHPDGYILMFGQHRQKRSEELSKIYSEVARRPGAQEAARQKALVQHADPEMRERHRQACARAQRDPAQRQKLSEITRLAHQDPELEARRSAAISAGHARRRAQRG